MTEKHQCSENVFEVDGFDHQCQKTATVERNGKWYCTIHDPEYINAKREKRNAKWDAERKARKERYALDDARNNATEGLSLAELQSVTPGQIRALPELIEALKRYDVNINFVNDTNPRKYELLGVLTYDLRNALSKAGVK